MLVAPSAAQLELLALLTLELLRLELDDGKLEDAVKLELGHASGQLSAIIPLGGGTGQNAQGVSGSGYSNTHGMSIVMFLMIAAPVAQPHP